MQPSPQTPGNKRKGNRALLFRYALLALLITALTAILLIRFFQQQQYKKLHAAVEELAETRQQKDWIGDAIQNMYAAENHFRFFTLTYQNAYFARYSDALRNVSADLDSLEQHQQREAGLGKLLATKRARSDIFIRIKRSTDSLIAMTAGWDTTRERNPLRPLTAMPFKHQVQVDTIRNSYTATRAGKKKKLFGRIADAVANKNNAATDSAASTSIVKTTVSDARSKQYNEQQLQKIHAYYTDLFRKVSAGQANLNRHEYEMVAANDRMLKTLQTDLQALKHDETEALAQRQQAQAADIGILLARWNRDTLGGTVLIVLLLALVLALIYSSYRISARLNVARLEALRFSKLKSDFVSNMSHEIRTPLSSVIGFTEQLKNTALQGEQEEMVDAIQLSSSMLLSVVNNVLDFSKLEEGKLQLEAVPFSPRQVVEEVSKGMQVQAEQKNIELRERFGFAGGEMVEGDAFRLKQVLVNLVSNAVKFTPVGGSVLIDAVLFSQNGRRILEVAVKDSGIGMSGQQLKQIFEEYTQLPVVNAEPGAPKGSGLGLAIVKKIVDLHHGTVQVDSKPGEGSTFRVTLPYKTAVLTPVQATIPAPTVPAAPPHISRALIVEDNLLNRRLLEIILERLNIAYATATNGIEGLQMMKEQHFDIVFTDIAMPEMDGLEMVRHIRRLPDTVKAGTPIIAITGNAVKEELDLYMRSGFTSYILKPFRETEVVEKINATRKNGKLSKQE